MRWTVEQVAAALGVAAPTGVEAVARVAGVSIDSRALRAGELFVAIHGPRHDGHTFVAAALADGAPAAVVARSRVAEYPEEIQRRLYAVDDPLAALQLLAREVRRAWGRAAAGRKLAAVTGSTGKTTTKEILAALLGARLRVLKSEANLNNEYGLPLTLLRLEEGHEAAVVEVGMSARGELARLAEIGEPNVGVVTNVAPVHLEFFASVDEIALAKRELIERLAGRKSLAVLNADDERVASFKKYAPGQVLTFGIKAPRPDFWAHKIKDRGIAGTVFTLESPWDVNSELELPLPGRHNVMNALAALAAASAWGIGAEDAGGMFRNLRPSAMRGEVLRFEEGFAVINDCYNSNPLALEQMMALLAATPGYRRRIIVAGEMLELGEQSAALHRECGRKARESADWVLGVQGNAKEIVAGAMEAGLAKSQTGFFENSEEAAKFVAGFVTGGDLLLVKGSRGVRMERVVEELRNQKSELRTENRELRTEN